MNEFHFGENLRIVRQAKGISQEAMALFMGMSQTSFCNMEKRSTVPSHEVVERLAKVLEVEPSLLLSGRNLEDLIPKVTFEQRAKEIMNTAEGVGLYWIIVIPFADSVYYAFDGFSRGFEASETVTRVVRFAAGAGALCFAWYWMRRMQKGTKHWKVLFSVKRK